MSAHVLVVDDEPGMRETLADILTSAGYQVTVASDGDAALGEVAGTPYQAVVMDIRMPGRDGVSVLREMGPPPPQVIMMTGYALDEQLRGAVEAQAFAIVHKPFHVRHMLDLVANAVESAA